MKDWYRQMRERVRNGENPIDLAIEKYDKVVNGEIPAGNGFDDCPLCVKFHCHNHEIDECWECPVYKAGQGCLEHYDSDGNKVIFEQLIDFEIEVEDSGNDPEAVKALHDFIRDVIIPGLRELKARQELYCKCGARAATHTEGNFPGLEICDGCGKPLSPQDTDPAILE